MKKDTVNLIILWTCILAYFLYFSFLSILKLNSFSYFDFDLAVHTQSFWNITHGSIYNSILGIPFLGNHMHLILFILAPFYVIFPHPEVLLILQTLFLSLGAFPLYFIAKKRLDPGFALITALGYLLYPWLAFTNLFEFHPTPFAAFFLILALYAYDFDKIKLFVFSSIFAMISQENIPMAIIAIGIMAFFERKKLKWVFFPVILGVIYFVPALILMGYFNQGTVQFSTLYSHLGLSSSNVIINPLTALGLFFRWDSFAYIFRILLPLLFIPLFALIKLFPAVPFFLQHILSARPHDLSMYYHYTAEIIPFLFYSFIYGIGRMLKFGFFARHAPVLKIVLFSFIIFNAAYFGPHIKESFRIDNDFRRDYLDVYKERFIAEVPRSASTVATFEFLPKLANRKRLYSLHHPYTGFYTISNKKYVLSEDTEYALIDFNDRLIFKKEFYRPENYKKLQSIFLEHDWELVDMIDSLVLLRKSSGSSNFICNKVNSRPGYLNKEVFRVGGDFALIGSRLSCLAGKNTIQAIFYWESIKETEKDIQMCLSITDGQGTVIKRLVHPICYRIFPTLSWKPGEVYKEILNIYLPQGYSKGKIFLAAGFYNQVDGKAAKVVVGGEKYDFTNIGSLKCKK